MSPQEHGLGAGQGSAAGAAAKNKKKRGRRAGGKRNADVPDQQQQHHQEAGPSTENDEAVAAVESHKGKGKKGKMHKLPSAMRKALKAAREQAESQAGVEVEGKDEDKKIEGDIPRSSTPTPSPKRRRLASPSQDR